MSKAKFVIRRAVAIAGMFSLCTCSQGAVMRGKIAGLDKIAQQAERNGAIRCAPRELAMAKSHLKLVTPTTEKRTVTPKLRPNADLRTREYLTEAEVERLLKATKGTRWAHRDATMILVAFRHGLRATEAADLR